MISINFEVMLKAGEKPHMMKYNVSIHCTAAKIECVVYVQKVDKKK